MPLTKEKNKKVKIKNQTFPNKWSDKGLPDHEQIFTPLCQA